MRWNDSKAWPIFQWNQPALGFNPFNFLEHMTTGGQIGEYYLYLSDRKAVFSEYYSTKIHGIKPRNMELRAAQMNRPSHGLQGARVPQGILGILVWGTNNRNSFKLG